MTDHLSAIEPEKFHREGDTGNCLEFARWERHSVGGIARRDESSPHWRVVSGRDLKYLVSGTTPYELIFSDNHEIK